VSKAVIISWDACNITTNTEAMLFVELSIVRNGVSKHESICVNMCLVPVKEKQQKEQKLKIDIH
jgi:hypothetical protein